MNLIVDIGNTLCKWAIFNQDQIISKGTLDQINKASLSDLFEKFPMIDRAILSAVRNFPEEYRQMIAEKTTCFIELNHETPTPIINRYKSLETLGLDRLAAAIGGTILYPNTSLLIIDAGTAITIDVVNSINEYLGGNISPGLQTRFKALNHFTGKLPLINLKDEFEMIGHNTETAIRIGVQQGVIFEIEGYIQHFSEKYPGLKTLLTGGDSQFLFNHLNTHTELRPNLTLRGLNAILQFNTV